MLIVRAIADRLVMVVHVAARQEVRNRHHGMIKIDTKLSNSEEHEFSIRTMGDPYKNGSSSSVRYAGSRQQAGGAGAGLGYGEYDHLYKNSPVGNST
jgi:hypothetical protein